jgi:acyltransferase
MAPQRSLAIDVVRVVGVVAVVVGHLYDAGNREDPTLIRTALFSWHVPVFFFLTGYLWRRGRRTVAEEARSRAWTLLVPYAIWTGILGAYWFTRQALAGQFDAHELVSALWAGGRSGGVFAPHWFLPVLFLTAVLLRALDRLPGWVAWMLAAGGVLFCSAFGSWVAFDVPWAALFAVPCLAFVLVGRWMAAVRDRLGSAAVPTGLVLLATSAALLATGIARPVDIKLGYFGTPVLGVLVACAISAALVLFAEAAFSSAPGGRAGDLVSEIAQVSIVVLLLHTFTFDPLLDLGIPIHLVLPLSLLLTWGVALAAHRSPASRLLVGIPRLRVAAGAGATAGPGTARDGE